MRELLEKVRGSHPAPYPNVVLFGRAGSGKSTAAEYLVRRYGYRRFAFADYLKEIVRELFDCGASPKPRSLYQAAGRAMRDIDPDCWVRAALRRMARAREGGWTGPFVIDDGRYINEYLWLRQAATVVVLTAPEDIRIRRLVDRDGGLDGDLNHESEREVDLVAGMDDAIVYRNTGSLRELEEFLDRIVGEGRRNAVAGLHLGDGR